MIRCPKCGRYMNSYIEQIYGNIRNVWTCQCGYSTRNDVSTADNKTTYVDSNFNCSDRIKTM